MLSLLVVHRATENSTHFLISTPLNSCGTLVNETEDELIFWNEIRADAVIIDNVITRTHDIRFKFYCSYSRRKMLSIQFQPRHIFIGSEGTWIMLSSFFFFLQKVNIEIGNFRRNFFRRFRTGVPKCPLSLYSLCFKYSYMFCFRIHHESVDSLSVCSISFKKVTKNLIWHWNVIGLAKTTLKSLDLPETKPSPFPSQSWKY